VAELIASQGASFTAADLMADAQRRKLRIGRATVFRALETLATLGVLERLEMPGGEHAYVTCQPRVRHHHHVVCERCGRASEIVGCTLDQWASGVEQETGFSVATHRVELYGLCAVCREEGETESRQAI
jgi:Fur family ferric uptake transcriptional regulator